MKAPAPIWRYAVSGLSPNNVIGCVDLTICCGIGTLTSTCWILATAVPTFSAAYRTSLSAIRSQRRVLSFMPIHSGCPNAFTNSSAETLSKVYSVQNGDRRRAWRTGNNAHLCARSGLSQNGAFTIRQNGHGYCAYFDIIDGAAVLVLAVKHLSHDPHNRSHYSPTS